MLPSSLPEVAAPAARDPQSRSGAVSSSARLLLVACLLNAGAAFVAFLLPVGATDLLLHSRIVEACMTGLTEQGWGAFQDPWSTSFNGGFALARVYPHLGHQLTALFALLTGLEAHEALPWTYALAVLLLPSLAWLGGRMLGLSPQAAALAAFVVATMHSADPRGHAPIEYGFTDGVGMAAQVWGMGLAALVLPAWVAASSGDGRGLARLSRTARVVAAAALLSLLVRTHLPSTTIVVVLTPALVLFCGPRSELPLRLFRFGAVGLLALVLSAGYLLPFFSNLGAIANSSLEARDVVASVGAVEVLKGLFSGDYFDGGLPGPWTLGLLLAGALSLRGLLRPSAGVDPMIKALAASSLLALMLLFGRETWGDWVDSVPLLGRFHDERYLLGLQLLGPWLIGAGLVDLARRVEARRGPSPPLLAGTVLLFAAALLHVAALQVEVTAAMERRPAMGVLQRSLEPVIADARARPYEPVTIVDRGPWPGSVNPLQWLMVKGAPSSFSPGHHYSFIAEFSVFWFAWLEGHEGLRDRPVVDADLRVMATSRRLVLPRDEGGAVSGPWRLESMAPRPDHFGDVALVRSDLLLGPVQAQLDGFPIAWFRAGLHHRRQHPTIAVRGHSPWDPERYERTASLNERDPRVFEGLPGASDGELGSIRAVRRGVGPWDRRIEVEVPTDRTWLMVGLAWHPGWEARIDGAPEQVRMLTPGFLGVPLPPGESTVELRWRAAAWRGPWAALNTLVVLVMLLWVLRRWGARS
jgi:hypothetical protein